MFWFVLSAGHYKCWNLFHGKCFSVEKNDYTLLTNSPYFVDLFLFFVFLSACLLLSSVWSLLSNLKYCKQYVNWLEALKHMSSPYLKNPMCLRVNMGNHIPDLWPIMLNQWMDSGQGFKGHLTWGQWWQFWRVRRQQNGSLWCRCLMSQKIIQNGTIFHSLMVSTGCVVFSYPT